MNDFDMNKRVFINTVVNLLTNTIIYYNLKILQ